MLEKFQCECMEWYRLYSAIAENIVKKENLQKT